MAFSDWVRESAVAVREDGIAGLREAAYQLYLGAWKRTGRVYDYGYHVYDADWDLLVVLDACRYDLLCEVEAEYEWLSAEPRYSIAGASREWLQKTFSSERRDETKQTAYVTGNIFSDEVLDENQFFVLDEVWKYNWDDDAGTIRPRALTDRAVHHHRERDPDRLIVHYMQPHYPFVADPLDEGPSKIEIAGDTETVWQRIRAGEVDPDEAWDAYRENLRYVLDEVELLLDNVDAEKVLITADHGNLFGEWGLYGHENGVTAPALRRVPWCWAEATDTRSYEPKSKDDESETIDDENVRERLRELGYLG